MVKNVSKNFFIKLKETIITKAVKKEEKEEEEVKKKNKIKSLKQQSLNEFHMLKYQ